MGYETQFSSKFGVILSLSYPFFPEHLQPIIDVMCIVAINVLEPCAFNHESQYLIKFHDFVDNSQEGMKHQMTGATQAQHGMTLGITLMFPQSQVFFSSCINFNFE